MDRLTGLGERVLLLAKRERVAPERLQDSLEDLRLLGLQAMIDPPRPGALEAVQACRRAGIRVLMVMIIPGPRSQSGTGSVSTRPRR